MKLSLFKSNEIQYPLSTLYDWYEWRSERDSGEWGGGGAQTLKVNLKLR